MSKALSKEIESVLQEFRSDIEDDEAMNNTYYLNKITNAITKHNNANIRTVHRDAVTGKFVKKQDVVDNPTTTVTSRIKGWLGLA